MAADFGKSCAYSFLVFKADAQLSAVSFDLSIGRIANKCKSTRKLPCIAAKRHEASSRNCAGSPSDEGESYVDLANARLFDGSQTLPGLHSVSLDGDRITAVDAPAAANAEYRPGRDDAHAGMISGHMHADIYKFSFAHNQAGIMVGAELPPGVLMAIAMRTCGVLIDSGFTGYLGASCSNNIDAQL